jgi:hypothetical protein
MRIPVVRGLIDRRILVNYRVEVSTGLLATLFSSSSAAQLSPVLIGSTLNAALWLAAGKEPTTGLISTNVSTLVKGATTIMFTSKLKIVTALVLIVGLGITGFGLLRHQALAANESNTTNGQAEEQETRDPAATVTPVKPAAGRTLRVVVLDPVLRVVNGLITEEVGLDDGVTALQQLDLIRVK